MSADLYVVTVRQPWAQLIVEGWKDVENRGWASKHRGLLAIHAGLSVDLGGYQWADRLGIDVAPPDDLLRQHIIGLVNLDDVVSDADSPWADPTQPCHWLLSGAVLLDRPVPARGYVGVRRAPALIAKETMRSARQVAQL